MSWKGRKTEVNGVNGVNPLPPYFSQSL
jgi:hypothetical protein